jgi:hypothetical protein
MKRLLPRLTYANVISTLCLFLLLGGGAALAATQLGKNSVGTKQLKKNAVTGAKVKNHTLTGQDIKLSKLGTVPSAAHATVADSANALSPPEATHLVGAPGEPGFQNGDSNISESGLTLQPVGFFKDHEGVVHLEGVAKITAFGQIFTLPPGYRPSAGIIQVSQPGEQTLLIAGSGVNVSGVLFEGGVYAQEEGVAVLTGITFRAGS